MTLKHNLQKRFGSVVTPALLAGIRDLPRTCHLCGDPGTAADLELEHLFPSSRGGPTRLDNLRWSHKICNRMKGDLTPFEFYHLCVRIRKHLAREHGKTS